MSQSELTSALSDFVATLFIYVALNYGCLRASVLCVGMCVRERKREAQRAASVYQVTMRQHVQLYEGACINNFHSEKSNFLHLPANCSPADTLDWCDLSF